MEEDKQISTKYINTPFAYARAQKGLTLLQQNVMVRVVAHLQGYMDKFFKTPILRNSEEDPKPLMTEDDKDSLPPVRIELSELGVSSSSYSRVRSALEEVLDVKIEKTIEDENGKPVKRLINMFSKIDTPVTDKKTTVRMRVNKTDEDLTEVQVDRTRGYIDIHLNKEVLWEMFDMNQGYVSHPEDIARIGKVDNMPLMYYLIRHKMLNFKLSKARVTLTELRDYLGMQKRDDQGRITDVKYPRYSQFKSRIINTALGDIKRVCDAGQIDFYFDMVEIRPRGKKTGDPDYLEFVKVGRNDRVGEQPSFDFPTSAPVPDGSPSGPSSSPIPDTPGSQQWQQFLTVYTGTYQNMLSGFSVKGFDGSILTLTAPGILYDFFSKSVRDGSPDAQAEMISCLRQCFGPDVKVDFIKQ